jgi:hypothetical protein
MSAAEATPCWGGIGLAAPSKKIAGMFSKGRPPSTCAVAGRTGVLVFDNFAGTTSPSAVGNAHFVLSGSGALAGLHGQATAIITPTPQGPFGVYTAQYSFGP